MDLYRYDEALTDNGARIIAGIDEAGRGPLAGPVVAAAVILHRMEVFDGLRDSKRSLRMKESGSSGSFCAAVDIGVGIVEAVTIDRINILNATKSAMTMVGDLSIKPDLLVIDAVQTQQPRHKSGIDYQRRIHERLNSCRIHNRKGREGRDNGTLRRDISRIWIARHKGYATGLHLNRIAQHGPCPIHRKSFNKVLSLQLPLT